MITPLYSVLNIGLRGASLLAKFLLVIYIGKHFSIEDLGIFGIFVTSITIAYFIVGFDFYNYCTREILATKEEEHLSIIRNQFLFYLFSYATFFPLVGVLFITEIIPFNYILPFYLILILEHLSQEFYRLFTTLAEPIFANVLLFLRSGVWVYILILIWYFKPGIDLSLIWVWWAWIIGATISVLIAIIKLYSKYKGNNLRPLKRKWFIEGLKVSGFFLGATIAYKVVEFSDRYMIDIWLGKESVGIYTFYNQIANLINIVIFTLVIMVIYPRLIKHINSNETSEFNILRKYMFKSIVFYSLSLAFILRLVINPLISLMDKEEFYLELDTFNILLLSNVILNISFVSHYVLFAYSRDRTILIATCSGAVLNIILNMVLIPIFGIIGAAIATAISFTLIWILKYRDQTKIVSN